MRNAILLLIAMVPLTAADQGWVSLFNGKDLTGWKANESPGTFTVQDGAIVAHGPRSHCFYVGDFNHHSFTNFELKVDVMTRPKANGGIYILTEYQVRINGKEAVNWTQPAGWAGTSDFPERRIGAGTIALQGHDPGSMVYYKNIQIRLLK